MMGFWTFDWSKHAATRPTRSRRTTDAAAASRLAAIIVFGSYARGDATEGSDLDLVVVG